MRVVLTGISRKKAPHRFCAFLAVILFSTIASITVAQQKQETAGLTDFPVPSWPQDGVIPPALKDRYVFVDLAKNEYVLAYPANLGTPAFEKEGPGSLKISRYELLRNVDPAVLLELPHPPPPKSRYPY